MLFLVFLPLTTCHLKPEVPDDPQRPRFFPSGTFGSLAMLPVALLEPVSFSYSSRAWGIILFAIAFPSVGAYLLNNYALQRAPASTVAVYIYLQPVISTVMAIWILDERAGWDLAVGAACIFSGVAIASRRTGNPQPVQNP